MISDLWNASREQADLSYQAASEPIPCPPPPESLCNWEEWVMDSSADPEKKQSGLEIDAVLNLYCVFTLSP